MWRCSCLCRPCVVANATCRAGCQDYFPGLLVIGQLRLNDEVIKELMGDVLAAEQEIEKALQTMAPQARQHFEKMKARVDEFESRGAIDAPTAQFLKEEIARADASLSIEKSAQINCSRERSAHRGNGRHG